MKRLKAVMHITRPQPPVKPGPCLRQNPGGGGALLIAGVALKNRTNPKYAVKAEL